MSVTVDIDTALAEGILQRCPDCGEVYAVLHECSPEAPGLQTADRCPDCGGCYGPPDLARDPYDFPCCCAWPPALACPGTDVANNPALGEWFTKPDGTSGWYSSDGLWILVTRPVRASFNAPDGRPLFVYPNPDVRPARGEAGAAAVLADKLAAALARAERAEAEATRLQTIVRRQDDELARLVQQDAQVALLQLEHEAEIERARRAQVMRILEAPELTPAGRVTVALAADTAAAYSLPLTFGEEPETSEPAPVNIAELERRAGIAAGSASSYLGPAAEAGLISREVHRQTLDTAAGTEFRSLVLVGPGSGRPAERRRDPRRLKENARKASEREARAAHEAALRARVQELQEAAAEAERGCTICAGPLLPTGYFCPRCGIEHSTVQLAQLHDRQIALLGEIHPIGSNSPYWVDSGGTGRTRGNAGDDGQHLPREPDPPDGGRRAPSAHRCHPD